MKISKSLLIAHDSTPWTHILKYLNVPELHSLGSTNSFFKTLVSQYLASDPGPILNKIYKIIKNLHSISPEIRLPESLHEEDIKLYKQLCDFHFTKDRQWRHLVGFIWGVAPVMGTVGIVARFLSRSFSNQCLDAAGAIFLFTAWAHYLLKDSVEDQKRYEHTMKQFHDLEDLCIAWAKVSQIDRAQTLKAFNEKLSEEYLMLENHIRAEWCIL